MVDKVRKYWDLVLGTLLVAFACWLLFHDIKADGHIDMTTAACSCAAFLAGGLLIDPVKIKEIVTLWLTVRSNKPQP